MSAVSNAFRAWVGMRSGKSAIALPRSARPMTRKPARGEDQLQDGSSAAALRDSSLPAPLRLQLCDHRAQPVKTTCTIASLETFNSGNANYRVGYGWLSLSTGVVELAFGITWIMRPHEAVRYGNFVLPNWRGRGIQSFVNAAVNAYARDLGIARTIASISTLNTQSMSLAKHYRTATTMKLVLVHIRGLNWTIHRASGAPFESRLIKPV
jgi:hypothetical protein